MAARRNRLSSPLGLVVDADFQVRTLFAETLRRAGLRLLEARSGSEALRLARTAEPEFVVTNLEIPDLNGLESCRQLRQSTPLRTLYIVLVSTTAPAEGDDTLSCFDAVLPKPCAPSLLLATIRRLLDLE